MPSAFPFVEEAEPGRFWLFYNGLVASMALVVAARNEVLFLWHGRL